ncbi:single-stranded-DNA-specific exonuclease RecJ [Synechococcus sp. AH-601-P18]|nr:single-stranded-DNA-specific exonuclease RecJ [Synechococcus sp. AH-601-P18]
MVDPDPLPGLELPLALRALLQRRGFRDVDAAKQFLIPTSLPEADLHFPDLKKATDRLVEACKHNETVAICGDYDADGMTSTALLLRALAALGAAPRAAIPSRMEEGYGLNPSMVDRQHRDGVQILVTVDNGVAASAALRRAAELGMEVIVTDHHTIPDQPAPMTALIHPATTPEGSPYRGLAGVGLAYVLARAVAEQLNQPDAIGSARDLFCVGTVADMAPLIGANRAWLLDGLAQLHRTECCGLQALQRLAGLGEQPLTAEDIGFQLAPRINAVGRLGEPRLVVDLLTAVEPATAMALARRCDDFNRQRRDLCDAIEAEAVALVEADASDQLPSFLLLAQSHWHHGVIGIVAARLVERYHRPAALLAGDGDGLMRASVRSPRGFAVDQALNHCASHLERFGGHPAAGGFTVRAENVHALHEQLCVQADSWLEQQSQGLPIQPDALLRLDEVNWDLWKALQSLAPFGVGHEVPLFWSRDCSVEEQRELKGGHLALRLRQGETERRAIAWRWDFSTHVPERCDLAYRISVNRWQGEQRLQLEMKAIRLHSDSVMLQRGLRNYVAKQTSTSGFTLTNCDGRSLQAKIDKNNALFSNDELAKDARVNQLLEEAVLGLGLRP